MKRIFLITLCVVLTSTLFSSCILDPPENALVKERPDVEFKPLTERDHVLFNIQLAYNERDLSEYKRVLDPDNFIFLFAPGDFARGDTPEQWAYDAEIAATTNMFNRNFNGDDVDPITKIDLDLEFAVDNWIAETPTDPKFAGETWFTKDVRYTMFIKTSGPIDFLSTDIRAQFTIRQVDEGGTQVWKTVRWRDDLDQNLARMTP